MSESSVPLLAPAALVYVVGIDIGMESCMMCSLTMQKRQMIKPSPFANTAEGFKNLFERLGRLETPPDQILVGLEATSRYGESYVPSEQVAIYRELVRLQQQRESMTWCATKTSSTR